MTAIDQAKDRVLQLRGEIARGFLARHPGTVTQVRLQDASVSLADGGQWEERDAAVQFATSDAVSLSEGTGVWTVGDITKPLLADGWRTSHQQTTRIQDCLQVSRDGYHVSVCGDTSAALFVLSVIGPVVQVDGAEMARLIDERASDFSPRRVPAEDWAG